MNTSSSSLRACAALVGLCAASLAQSSFPNQVAAGDVADNSATLWAATQNPGIVIFQIDDSATFGFPFRLAVDLVFQPAEPAKVEIRGLRPGRRYWYRAFGWGGTSPTGSFVTANRPGDHRGLRFGTTGDWRGELSPYPAVRNVPADLDFFVLLGDTIYADYPSPAVPLPQATTLPQYRAKHREVYSERFGLDTLGDLRRRTAIFAMIDDHEVTNDFAGGADPASDPRFLPTTASYINQTQLYRRGLTAFTDYNPIEEHTWSGTNDPRMDGAPRLYRAQRYGDDAAIFVLDARSFRDTGLPPVLDLSNQAEVLQFLIASFDPTRTMLGQAQLQRLQQDLLATDQAGVTWKFVFVPEPIQNLGVLAASDRFEGYAAERSALLGFIDQHQIENVVFVTADLHGTLVNDLSYQAGPGQPQIPLRSFEIVTGSVAFDAPFGPTVIELAGQVGLLTPAEIAFYDSLPTPGKDGFVQSLIDGTLAPLGYDPLGITGTQVQATLLAGGWTATHTFGWTEFDIDADTQSLTVTTYGVPAYTEAELLADPAAITALQPQIVQQFVVTPQ